MYNEISLSSWRKRVQHTVRVKRRKFCKCFNTTPPVRFTLQTVSGRMLHRQVEAEMSRVVRFLFSADNKRNRSVGVSKLALARAGVHVQRRSWQWWWHFHRLPYANIISLTVKWAQMPERPSCWFLWMWFVGLHFPIMDDKLLAWNVWASVLLIFLFMFAIRA